MQLLEGAVMTEVREELRLNMGPHHPSTHGVLRFILHTDGEVMRKAVPDVGYLHRGIEKLAEKFTYPGFMPITDRINYLEGIFCNHVYAMAVEKLLGIEAPPRAEYLRVIASEVNRLASHYITLGSVAMDVGAVTPFVYMLREREALNDLMEELTGQRLTYNYARVGGVAFDATDAWLRKLEAFLNHFEPVIDEFNSLITGNEIFINRLANVAPISKAEAMGYGLVGPNLRASGVDWDLRRDLPYSVYRDFDFAIPVGKGDLWVRHLLRPLRCAHRRDAADCRILRQALAKLPSGDIRTKVARIKPPAGEVYAAVEGARGELGMLPRVRRHRQTLPAENPLRLVRGSQHHRARQCRAHDCRPRRGHRNARHASARDGPLARFRPRKCQWSRHNGRRKLDGSSRK